MIKGRENHESSFSAKRSCNAAGEVREARLSIPDFFSDGTLSGENSLRYFASLNITAERSRVSELFRHSTFGFHHFAAAKRPRSHMLDHVVAELRTLDLGRAFHQPREI